MTIGSQGFAAMGPLEAHTERWPVVYHGLEYPAEVIFAPRWDPAWGRRIVGESRVRVVFLDRHHPYSATELEDARIAVCVPEAGSEHQRERLEQDMRAIAETRALYRLHAHPDAVALRRALEEQETKAAQQRRQEELAAYQRGRIYTLANLALNPRQVFASADRRRWAQELAGPLLAWAYPSLPLDPAALPRPLSRADVPLLFRALVNGDQAPECQEAARQFAPGLRLPLPDASGILAGEHCPPFGIIRETLEHHGGRLPWAKLEVALGHTHGLPSSLSLLYLLCFVKWGRDDVGLELRQDHRVITLDGAPFPGRRLTRHTVGEVHWQEELGEQVAHLLVEGPPSWDEALPYAVALWHGLGLADETATPQPNEEDLGRALHSLRRLTQQEEYLDALAVALGQPLPPQCTKALARLAALAGASEVAQFYHQCAASYPTPSALERDAALARRVGLFVARGEELQRVRTYLAGVALGSGHQVLALDYAGLAMELNLEGLLSNPGLVDSLWVRFHGFRSSYGAAYAGHHARYQREAHVLRQRLEVLRPQVEALVTFNAIPELGLPTASHVPGQFHRLLVGLKLCNLAERDISLEESPRCLACGLQMSDEVPRREAESLILDLTVGLREKNGRLASRAVRQILKQDASMVDRFLRLVQSADPTTLAHVLDDEVVQFLREFLRHP